jgi:hypothetical protein
MINTSYSVTTEYLLKTDVQFFLKLIKVVLSRLSYCEIQWKPLNVITDDVIIRLL